MSKFLIKQPSFNVKRKFFANDHKQFMLIFAIAIVFGFGLTRWENITYQKNYNLAANNPNQSMGSVMGAYTSILTETDKPADTLLFEGINLIRKNQIDVALLTLEEAVKSDPNYRDAALYTGYIYLKLSNSDQQNPREYSKISKIRALEKAREYLEKARGIDPLYAKTHEYLAIVYNLLGDSQNAQLSTQRAQDFSK